MAKLLKAPSTALTPVPAVLVTAGTMEASDVTTLAWVGTVCSEPPMISISVRPERWLHHFIVEGGAFVVNVADTAHARALDLCGHVSGKDTDKWELSALTREQGTATAVPLVAECPLNIECVVRQTLHLGTHDMFIGEVVAVHLEERVRAGGRLLDPVCYVSGQYWKLGDLIGPMGFSRT
jgi:flavin reductase (DIM6/NTAB) family NADH-FMN oxidoreductase RutF